MWFEDVCLGAGERVKLSCQMLKETFKKQQLCPFSCIQTNLITKAFM